jgi:hypothetical protein
MTFESVHDMAYPIEALRRMKDMVSANDAVLVGDVKMKDNWRRKMILQVDSITISVYCFVFHSPWNIQILRRLEQL